MSKRPTTSGQGRGASKRKRLSEEYGVATSTVSDLKKQKEQILHFYDENDVPKLMDKRKSQRPLTLVISSTVVPPPPLLRP